MPKVLIVDDSKTDRVRAAGIASKWSNCVILEAENGRVALDVIETHRPDLVLTDLQMPEMNGLDLVEAVREEYPHIPVILMTGQGSEKIASEALRAGAASYVPKGRLPQDLPDTLQQVHSAAEAAHSQFRLMHYLTASVNHFSLPNDLSLIRGCVSQVLNMLRCLPLGDESERLRVGIALQEAVVNACLRGNLELPPEDSSDATRLTELAAMRTRQGPWAHRRINVTIDISRDRAVFQIRDEGTGFDFGDGESADECALKGDSGGRGLVLMRSIMDEVVFQPPGNEVTMTKYAVTPADDEEDPPGDRGAALE